MGEKEVKKKIEEESNKVGLCREDADQTASSVLIILPLH